MEILLVDFRLELDDSFNEKHLNNILCQYYTDNEELQSRDKPSNPIVYFYLIETLLLTITTCFDVNITDYCNILLYVVNQLYSIYLLDVVTLNNDDDHLFNNEYYISIGFMILWLTPSTYYNDVSHTTSTTVNLLSTLISCIIIMVLNIQYIKIKSQNLKYVNAKYNYRTCNICHKFGGDNWVENRCERKKMHLQCLINE